MADAPPSEVQMRDFAALFAGLTLSACGGTPGDSGAEAGECGTDTFVESWILADIQAQQASLAAVDASAAPAFDLDLAGAAHAAGALDCGSLRCEAGPGFDACAQAACEGGGWTSEAWLRGGDGVGPVTLPLGEGQLRVEEARYRWTREGAALQAEHHLRATWVGERERREVSLWVEGQAEADHAAIRFGLPRARFASRLVGRAGRQGRGALRCPSPGTFGFIVFSASRADHERLLALHKAYAEALKAIALNPSGHEQILVANAHLFPLAKG